MLHRAPLRAAHSPDDDTLAAAIVSATRRARIGTLMAALLLGAAGVPVACLVPAHRVVLLSLALAIASFGSGGLADRILTDETSTPDADRIVVVGFTIVRRISVVIGVIAGTVCVAWMFVRAMGSNFWN